VAASAGNDVQAIGAKLMATHVETIVAQNVGEKRRGFRLISGRIYCIEADEILSQFNGVDHKIPSLPVPIQNASDEIHFVSNERNTSLLFSSLRVLEFVSRDLNVMQLAAIAA
jgi:hypothetical protein